ncbi:MAG: hypothetical protein RRY13_07605 [Akkermansia sp.]
MKNKKLDELLYLLALNATGIFEENKQEEKEASYVLDALNRIQGVLEQAIQLTTKKSLWNLPKCLKD